tara:strand:+ start:1014 stop:3959 length:2946 start_codon:yes stop_codon:yes gene_type:complete
MEEYEIALDNGYSFDVESDKPLTEEDAMFLIRKRQQDSLTRLGSGPGFTGERTERGKRIKENPRKFYEEEIPNLLLVPKEQFDYTKGLPVKLRSLISFIGNKSDQVAILRQEYGMDNVIALNLNGSQEILFKDKTGKWALTDPMTVDFFDFTTDLAAPVTPVATGIVAGLVAGAVTTPTTPLGSAAAFSAAAISTEAAVSAGQEFVARKVLGYDLEPGQVLKQTGKEALLNTGVDLLTLGIGKFGRIAVKPKGTGIVIDEAEEALDIINKRVPHFVQKGEEAIKRQQDIASTYPNSTAANFSANVRTELAQKAERDLTGEMSEASSERILTDGLETMTKQYDDDIAKVNNSLDSLAQEKEALKADKVPESALNRKARTEAKQAFQKELDNKVKNIVAKKPLLPEDAGLELQGRLARNYIEAENYSRSLFNESYARLQNVNTNSDRLSKIFNKRKQQAILDLEDEVVSTVAPGARTSAGTAASKLDDLGGQSVGFKQLNEMIQLVEERTRRGAATPGFNAAEYRALAKDLRAERERLLKQVSNEDKRLFNAANNNFQNVVLKYRENDIFKLLKTEKGESYADAILKASKERDFTIPRLKEGGTAMLKAALSSPKAAQDFLRLTGNSLEARRLLREQFLQYKGLVAGQPIPKSALKFSPDELSMVKALYPQSGAAGLNRKVEVLRRLQKFSDGADDYIDGISADTFNKLVNETVETNLKQIERVAREEILNKKRLNELNSTKLVKMMAAGDVPLPTNQTSMETFMDGIMKSSTKNADVDKLMTRMAEESPELLESFRTALYYHLTKRAGRGADTAQVDKLGYQIWDTNKMQKLLDDNKDKIRKIIGDEKFKQLDATNKGIKRFSVRKSGEAPGRESIAGSTSGFKLFLSNVGGAVKDRYTASMLAIDIMSPIKFGKMVTPDQYNKFMTAFTNGLLVTNRGFRAMLDNADADPEFRKSVTEMYASILETPEPNTEIPTQQEPVQ